MLLAMHLQRHHIPIHRTGLQQAMKFAEVPGKRAIAAGDCTESLVWYRHGGSQHVVCGSSETVFSSARRVQPKRHKERPSRREASRVRNMS